MIAMRSRRSAKREGGRIPASQPSSTPGRHVAQYQDFQTLPRCKHPFPERNALLSARFGFSGRFAEQIRSAMNQYGRSDIFGHHFVFVGDTDRALRTAVRVLDIRSRSNPSSSGCSWRRLGTIPASNVTRNAAIIRPFDLSPGARHAAMLWRTVVGIFSVAM
jgi:hypothetical protein